MPYAFNEAELEQATLEWFSQIGYDTAYAPDLSPFGVAPERERHEDVVLVGRLVDALKRINPMFNDNEINEAVNKITRPLTPNFIYNNRTFHKMLTEGIDIERVLPDGMVKTEKIYILDLDNIDNNDFLAVNQFTVIDGGKERRPDVVLFINGLPFVVIELKSTANEDVGIVDGFNQLQTYKNDIPVLFNYNAFVVTSDGVNAKVGTITSDFDRFMFWRTIDGKTVAGGNMPGLRVVIFGMFEKTRILDIIKNFILFVDDGERFYKILAGYHQYAAVKKSIYNTKKAITTTGDRKVGVIWHTTGSGKSYSMLFYTGQLVLSLDNPTIVVITDRNDLDDQLFNTFSGSKDYIRQTPKQADSRAKLRELLDAEAGGVIFTTIQKFTPDQTDKINELNSRSNIIVIADEAHRSQYGFEAKEKDGVISYGFAKYMRDALPNASFIGFTGTPVELSDKNTPALFGDYIDIYDLTQAVKDKTTVHIYYESRVAKLELNENERPIIDVEYEEITEDQEETYAENQKRKWSRLEAIAGSDKRIKAIAKDFVEHYDKRQKALFGKVMFVAMSRRIAAKLYDEIVLLRPEWHSDDINKGVVKIVMTSGASDKPELRKHSTTKHEKRELAKRFKNSEDELKVVIVRDMWLTGFDVPCLHTLYVDKPMSGHNLMQTISRVNRVFKDKPGGLIVDYIGIAENLRDALKQYTPSDRSITGIDPQVAIDLLLEKYECICDIFHGFDYSDYIDGTASQKMECIANGMDYILGLDESVKHDFLNLVAELGKAYALCSTSEEADHINIEISFFKAIKSSIIKMLPTDKPKKTKDEVDYAISQLVSKSIISDEVVDVLSILDIEKPDISILSDDFLEEVRGLPQKNLALELLKRLMDGKVKAMSRKNIVQAKKFSELLDNAINQYTKRSIETVQVISELIDMSKEMNDVSSRDKESMGLEEDEIAFYDAVSNNASAKEFMQDDVLKQIARDLTKSIKASAKVDWDVRESVRAQIRLVVKKLLKKYGYPPDKQAEAVELIIAQAERVCENDIYG